MIIESLSFFRKGIFTLLNFIKVFAIVYALLCLKLIYLLPLFINNMKQIFTTLGVVLAFPMLQAQWTKTAPTSTLRREVNASSFYKLDLTKIRTQLLSAPKLVDGGSTIINIPTVSGKIERFAVSSFSVVDEALASKYQLGSYTGVGLDDPSKKVRFSVSPNDFQAMIWGDGTYQFIEPATLDKQVYSLHQKTGKTGLSFVCSTKEDSKAVSNLVAMKEAAKSSNKQFHTLRLAVSVTGEYTNYFGGVDKALEQINATLTRVNGVFEQEFNLHVNMVNAPALIFTDASTDPYSTASRMCKWNYELMNVLHGGQYGITDADYDIGHLFGASGGGGNAGCIGCIGSNDVSYEAISATDPDGCGYAFNSPNNYKGSAFTSPGDNKPFGDNFDIDYVAHELGHQLGDSHTYSFYEQFKNTEVEPGSGSTIMGYAGITGDATDLQEHSDPYFHSVSIDQVQTNLVNKKVSVVTPIQNNTPIVTAMPTTYTIPKGTAFVLTAEATDPDGDALTYAWEQVDASKLGDGVTKTNIGSTASGASFRSWPPTSSPTRYFPKLSTVLGGSLKNISDFEAVSTVARTTNFRVTVRDNKVGGQAQTAHATQKVVVGTANAFTVNTPSGKAGEEMSIKWVVSGTNVAPYNVANVKIDYTADNGTTWTTLTESTPNNGSALVTFPQELGNKPVIVRVSAIGNIFYAVKKFTLANLSVNDFSNSGLQIYPNPVVDVLHISNAGKNAKFEILNIAGQLVKKGELINNEINVSSLAKGVYVIKMTSDEKSLTNKFEKR